MRFVSARRAAPALAAVAAAFALGVPGLASAKKQTGPTTDVLEQCAGPSIELEGSTFQAPADFLWTGVDSDKGNEKLETGFNYSTAKLACGGTQGSKKKPTAYYNQEDEFNRGSGSCLKTWGNGVGTFGESKKGEVYPRLKTFPACATDEAPSKAVKEEFEKYMEPGGEKGEGKAIESLPVVQGAEAIVVHLPKGCTATSEIETAAHKTEDLKRLALDQEVVEGIYAGTIKTWTAALAKQGTDGHDVLTCTAGGEGDTIRPVVRLDKSGTTHIFKSFLEQVNTESIPMEEFKEVNGEAPCSSGELEAGAKKTWTQVAEGCENQRWPEAANVLRPAETGNPGVVKEVNETESSVGYADLAVAAEYGFFAGKRSTTNGEGTEKFWAVLQDSEPGTSPVTFADPSTKGDSTKEGLSNCAGSKYVAEKGEPYPPPSTRDDWSKVKAESVSTTYSICGLTYLLAARQYYYFLEKYGMSEKESQEVATTVHDFVQYAVTPKDGGKVLKKHDYAPLSGEVAAEAELGAEEIGSKEG